MKIRLVMGSAVTREVSATATLMVRERHVVEPTAWPVGHLQAMPRGPDQQLQMSL